MTRRVHTALLACALLSSAFPMSGRAQGVTADTVARFENRVAQCEALPEEIHRNGCVHYCGRYVAEASPFIGEAGVPSHVARTLRTNSSACGNNFRQALERHATDCDRLAASPWDPERAADGVAFEAVDPASAVPACERALQDAPGTLRFAFQLGRALTVGGRHDEAYPRLVEAANAGYVPAQNNLAVMLANGRGTAQNLDEAVVWYRKAAATGFAPAQANLAQLLQSGTGVDRDLDAAAEWYRKAAEQDHPFAQLALGVMYERGEGVEQSYPEAIAWYQKAAYLGVAGAHTNLGVLHYEGRGVTQNHGRAARAFREAAELGDPAGQANLGMLYEHGQGVSQDAELALKWYGAAAEQGNVAARQSFEQLSARLDTERQAADEASYWIVDRYALSRMEILEQQTHSWTYREVVEEASPYLAERGYTKGTLRASGEWSLPERSIELRQRVWTTGIARHCSNPISTSATAAVTAARRQDTSELIPDTWVLTRAGQCQRPRVDVGLCRIHDCGEAWTSEDRQIVVKGKARAYALWENMTKRASDPEKIEYEWIPD